jgi:hypothetical protein
MIYLIQYDREKGTLVSVQEFADSEAAHVAEERLALEVSLARQGVAREVVVLEAASVEALKRTHQRYFARLDELAASSPPRP